MQDIECIAFLQRVLPRMKLRWPGFRKVHSQVCKRIARRLDALDLSDIPAYLRYLREHPFEWQILDSLCRVTITRFYRDKHVFGLLQQVYLPELAKRILLQGGNTLKVWSAGCASGEEPYSINLVWQLALASRFPGISLRVLATDADANLLQRAQEACYAYGSIKNLPSMCRDRGFEHADDRYCLRREFCSAVEFRRQDVRAMIPEGPFHLVLCRNLVFTYFDTDLQQRFLQGLQRVISQEGLLLLGVHERLPGSEHGFIACSARWGFYRPGVG